MGSGIVLTINLKGRISGPVKHTDKQIVTVDIAPLGAKYPEIVSRKIRHNDRIPTSCSRRLKISEEVVETWLHADCPHWEKPHQWKAMTRPQKIQSYLKSFDEGYGINYEFV